MIPPNPFLPPPSDPKPEDKFRGLIITGNVIAILLLIAILIIAAVTIRKSRINRITAEMQNDIAMMDTTAVYPDAVADIDDYSNYSADYQEELNDQEALKITLLQTDSTAKRTQIIETVNLIQQETDAICREIRMIASEFSDTAANAYSYNEDQVTNHFFITAGRGGVLLMKLHDYRQSVISAVDAVSFGNTSTLKESLPLDDSYTTGYSLTWDNSKLQGPCNDAIEYLKSMETEVRNFEATAYNRLPRSDKPAY